MRKRSMFCSPKSYRITQIHKGKTEEVQFTVSSFIQNLKQAESKTPLIKSVSVVLLHPTVYLQVVQVQQEL